MAELEPEQKLNLPPYLESYYASLETILGNDLLLGGARHHGFYDSPKTYNPFPIDAALRRMEEVLFCALDVGPGARVLDAGCGDGVVARYMVRKGLHVVGVDVIKRHVRKAREMAAKLAVEKEKAKGRKGKKGGDGEAEVEMGSFEVRYMDYHHLEALEPASFDAVYTFEAFVHATNPAQALAGFFRVLKPGGKIVMHEYDHRLEEIEKAASVSASTSSVGKDKGKTKKKIPSKTLQRSMRQLNVYASMPTLAISSPGTHQRLLREAGFVDIYLCDLSSHIRPMTRLFFALAIVPFCVVSLLGLERHFVNTVAGASEYRGYGFWRYVHVGGRKPAVGEGEGKEEEKGV